MDFKNWGHEYLHHLCGDISREYEKCLENLENIDHLINLVYEIVDYFV